jgi:hypothetical protein
MQSNATFRWRLRITGDPGVFEDVAPFLEPLDISILEQDGAKYLVSQRFETLSDGRAVLDLANETLAVVNGMLSMTTGGSGRLSVERVYRADEEGKPPTQFIFPDGIESENRFGIPTIRREGDPPPRKEDHLFHRILSIAGMDERARKVLRLIGSKPLDWSTLYRIYEVIEKDIGSIPAKDWATKKALSLFAQTANHQEASGDDARHGELSTKPPTKPMDIERARELIRHIADKWLREKIHR